MAFLNEHGLDNYHKLLLQGHLSKKVDKEEGKELVNTTDITQITTNKTEIEGLNTKVTAIESDLTELSTFLSTYA